MSVETKQRLEWVAVHAFAIAATLFFVLPFVFVALTAVMTDEQSLTRDLWPQPVPVAQPGRRLAARPASGRGGATR